MMTQMCVDTTARAAFDLGYELRVAADACAARPMTFNGVTVTAEMVNAAFMGAIGSVFAKCVSTEEITG
jgi:nicotinamidase-related amidase